MSSVYTKTPHQKIDNKGISSQWEGIHIRYDQDREEQEAIPSPRSGLTFKLKKGYS